MTIGTASRHRGTSSEPSCATTDSRCPKGVALASQGLTSGELWDIVVGGLLSLDGPAHQRQRKLVAKAFTPRAAGRLCTTCTDVIAELVCQASGTGRCDAVPDIARPYPDPDHLRAPRHPAGRLESVLRLGR